MDFTQEFPSNEACNVLRNPQIAAFGLTFRGASHKQSSPEVPCQDCHAMRWMEKEQLFLAVIADGVGSCRLSHQGAYTAVNTAIDCVQAALEKLGRGKQLKLDADEPAFRGQMKDIMLDAFRNAQDAVEQLAVSAGQPVFAFQSTLTLAIYDGTCLYHGHAGDDGIVAQLPDGSVEMATQRMKGEEANSVYPLQSGERAWSFGLVPRAAGFVMATDGVLDSFVQNHPDYFGINYCSGICYSFMESAMKGLADQAPDSAERVMEEYREFLQSEEYTGRVTDDLTMVAAVSPGMMAASRQPYFSLELWNTIARESEKAKRAALNHRSRERASRAPALPRKPAEALPSQPAPEAASPRPTGKRSARAKQIGTPLLAAALLAGIVLGILLAGFGRASRSPADLLRQEDASSQDHAALQEERDALQSRVEQLEKELDSLRHPPEACPPEETVSVPDTEGESDELLMPETQEIQSFPDKITEEDSI